MFGLITAQKVNFYIKSDLTAPIWKPRHLRWPETPPAIVVWDRQPWKKLLQDESLGSDLLNLRKQLRQNIFAKGVGFFVFEFQGAGMIQWQGKFLATCHGKWRDFDPRDSPRPGAENSQQRLGCVRIMSVWQASCHGVNDQNGCTWMWVFPKIGVVKPPKWMVYNL